MIYNSEISQYNVSSIEFSAIRGINSELRITLVYVLTFVVQKAE